MWPRGQHRLEIAPDLAVGDSALGFWKAIEEVFPRTRHQRCWVHKSANALNKVAISVQVNMKADYCAICGAPTSAAAEGRDVDKYGAKYDKAVACLANDREALLAFFDFQPSIGPSAHVEPDRERICDRASSNRAHKERAIGEGRQTYCDASLSTPPRKHGGN